MRDSSLIDAPPSSAMPDEFDRLMGALDGLPDVLRTKASTITVTPPLGVGGSRTFIVHTVRQRDGGDTVFLQMVGSTGSLRVVIPPSVADALARQRDALTTKSRSNAGKARAAADKLAGKVPAFLRTRRRAGSKK